MNTSDSAPQLSVIVLNRNGRAWLERCVESLLAQKNLAQIEILIVDNASTDGSDRLAEALAARRPDRVRYLQTHGNLGYCEGNNRGAAAARGRYLLFLNNDTWLENDCLEQLLAGVQAAGAHAASPLVCNYDSDQFQSAGATGFDLFGHLTGPARPLPAGPIFAAPGCALLVRRDVFERVGGFDAQFFMYADEADLAWRLTLAGYRTVTIPHARLHHRGGALANPAGGGRPVEFRTNEMVRFYVCRNGLLLLLKNAQHLLLGLAVLQALRILAEGVLVSVLLGRPGVFRRVYWRALFECWRLREHIRRERARIRQLRRHGDWWMLRFFRLRPACWREVRQLWKSGLPKVDRSEF